MFDLSYKVDFMGSRKCVNVYYSSFFMVQTATYYVAIEHFTLLALLNWPFCFCGFLRNFNYFWAYEFNHLQEKEDSYSYWRSVLLNSHHPLNDSVTKANVLLRLYKTKQGGAPSKHKSTTKLFSEVYGGEKTYYSSSWIIFVAFGKDWKGPLWTWWAEREDTLYQVWITKKIYIPHCFLSQWCNCFKASLQRVFSSNVK